MNKTHITAAICLIAACSANPARQTAERTEPTTQPTEAVETPVAQVEKVDMLHHWIDATRVRDAAIAGRLPQAREAADALAAQGAPTDAPGWAAYVQRIDGQVEAARSADTLAAMAAATANVGAACGECHAANGVNLQLPTGMPPAEGGDARAHMSRHAWAVHAMWDGLVGPSDGRWSDGIGMLTEKPLHETDAASPFVGTVDAEAAGARVHDAAVRGAGQSDPSARAAIFAEVVTACADCHSQTHTGPR